jgi:hypothetical protein
VTFAIMRTPGFSRLGRNALGEQRRADRLEAPVRRRAALVLDVDVNEAVRILQLTDVMTPSSVNGYDASYAADE